MGSAGAPIQCQLWLKSSRKTAALRSARGRAASLPDARTAERRCICCALPTEAGHAVGATESVEPARSIARGLRDGTANWSSGTSDGPTTEPLGAFARQARLAHGVLRGPTNPRRNARQRRVSRAFFSKRAFHTLSAAGSPQLWKTSISQSGTRHIWPSQARKSQTRADGREPSTWRATPCRQAVRHRVARGSPHCRRAREQLRGTARRGRSAYEERRDRENRQSLSVVELEEC